MKEIEGIWWTVNKNKTPGKLIITDENKIILTTYSKLYDTNIICGFAEGKKITLVDIALDRTDIYKSYVYKDEQEKTSLDEIYECNQNTIDEEKNEKQNKLEEKQNLEIEYSTYKYTAELAIIGNIYERKGDIRIKEAELYYTNFEEWLDKEIKMPQINIKQKIYS